MINLLLVDDSSFMRLVIADMLGSYPEMNVMATAENGKEALEKTKLLKPDVVLLDLVMKEYDGLYAVKQIMQSCPTPIIILSSLGNTNINAVFDAVEAGACDFLNKPNSEVSARIRNVEHQLIAKIRQAATVDCTRLSQRKTAINTNPHTFDSLLSYDILVIGASTGGTGAIEEILKKLPSNFPIPIVIAQHMPADFVQSFARRLNDMLPLTVKVGQAGEKLQRGCVYIAAGNDNTRIHRHEGVETARIELTDKKFAEFNHPSVDCLMDSVAEVYGKRAIAVILTGMGKDGAKGMEALSRKKALTIAQDEKTCVVFGMPKAAIEKGAIRHVLSLPEIPGFIVSSLS